MCIRDRYKGKGKINDKENLIRLSTVDRFQGMERNIIICLLYTSTAKLYAKSMQDIGNIDTDKITWVNSNGKLFRWIKMPPEEKQDLDKISIRVAQKW